MYKEEEKEKIDQIKREEKHRDCQFFRWVRTSQGMTQDQFCKKLGIKSNKSYISRIENESRSPGKDLLARIYYHFGKKPEDLPSPWIKEGERQGKIKILATDKEVVQDLKAGMILILSKKDMTNKGLFLTDWDFGGVWDYIEYKRWMKVEIDPNPRKRATAQIKGGFTKF